MNITKLVLGACNRRAAGQGCCLRLVSKSAGAGTQLCRIFHGSHRAAGAAEHSALGNAAALSHGKDLSEQRSCAAKLWYPDRPQAARQAASDAHGRRTQGGRSRAGTDEQYHVNELVARFKICTAIDKENRNDNFLITLHAGGCYCISRVIVVREKP